MSGAEAPEPATAAERATPADRAARAEPGTPAERAAPAGPVTPDVPAAPAPARDAATVVLLRDGAAGVEAFLLRRVRGMAFAGGMTVFPGGGVDSRDADAQIAWAGPPPAQWSAALSAPEPLARALVCAAVRETFEESGVLLAGPSPAAVCTVDGPGWEADRVALERRELSLGELLARRRLMLRADLLRPWAHWITPVGEPRRYDTRFFVAALPAGQRTRHIDGEAEVTEWLAPSEAIAQAGRGERGIMPPTAVTLEEIGASGTVAEVLAAAGRRQIRPVRPRLVREAGGLAVQLPGGREIALRARDAG